MTQSAIPAEKVPYTIGYILPLLKKSDCLTTNTDLAVNNNRLLTDNRFWDKISHINIVQILCKYYYCTYLKWTQKINMITVWYCHHDHTHIERERDRCLGCHSHRHESVHTDSSWRPNIWTMTFPSHTVAASAKIIHLFRNELQMYIEIKRVYLFFVYFYTVFASISVLKRNILRCP